MSKGELLSREVTLRAKEASYFLIKSYSKWRVFCVFFFKFNMISSSHLIAPSHPWKTVWFVLG